MMIFCIIFFVVVGISGVSVWMRFILEFFVGIMILIMNFFFI